MTNRLRNIDIQKQQGTYTALGYHTVNVTAREGRTSTPAAGWRHYEYDREKIINQSREFMRDNGIYAGMISRSVNYIIGNGFGLQVRSKNANYNKKVEGLWKDYWKKPEIKGVLSGPRMERMVARELFIAGDTGVLKIKGGLLQQIEAEQIIGKGASLKEGIETNDFGAPIRYYVSPYNTRGRVDTAKSKPIQPNNFIFVTDPDRPSSLRTVPPCQSTFPMLHRINDVCDSEAIAWQLLARLALSINRAEGDTLAFKESKEDTNSGSDTEGKLATRITELDYALIFHGEHGDEIKGIDRNIPGKNFSESIITFLRLLGLPLGLPLEIILLDWTKSNYSQSRAVLEQAFKTFTSWQNLIEATFLDNVFKWKLAKWVREGLSDRSDGLKHEWIKPTFPWIDQLKEAQAYAAKLDRSFTTHSQVCKSLNVEREDIVEAREVEIKDAIARAKRIEKDTGEKVPWQTFAGLEVKTPNAPDQTTEQTPEKNPQDDEEKDKDED